MNRALVRRAAAGLAAWLHEQHPDRVADGVVVGFDARHKSDEFAEDTCRGARRRRASRPPAARPAAHAGARLRRPPPRRGGRGDGHRQPQPAAGQRLQGLRPHRRADRAADRRRDLGGHRRGRAAGRRRRSATSTARSCTGSAPRCVDAYLEAVLRDAARCPARRPRASVPVVVYSAMHGVGGDDGRRACSSGPGSAAPALVAEQFEPDPDFPTVAFPNPEEPGAMDLSLATAARRAPTWWWPTTPTPTGWRWPIPDAARRRLAGGCCAGDEIGVLLADAVLADARGARRRAGSTPCWHAASCRRSCSAAWRPPPASRFEETLTGFKWIARAAGPEPPAAVRLRGGARLLRRRPRARQGRHQRRAGRGRRVAALGGSGAALADRLDDAGARSTACTPPASGRSGPTASTAWRASPRPCARCAASPPAAVAGRAVAGIEDLAVAADPTELPPGDVLVSASTAPGSSSARAAPSPSSSATSRSSSRSPGRRRRARVEGERALDALDAAYRPPLTDLILTPDRGLSS